MFQTRQMLWIRSSAIILAASLAMPLLTGCGDQANTPSGGSGARIAVRPRPAPSNGKKVVVELTDSALLYWLWKTNPQQDGQDVEYFRSDSNGQLYYRDKSGQSHLITPDPKGYAVAEEDLPEVKKYKGFKKQTTGERFSPPAAN